MNPFPFKILACVLAAVLAGCAISGDANPQIYDAKADGGAQLAVALQRAKSEHKRVLLNLGANWCSDSQAMFQLLTTGPTIHQALTNHYVLVLIDVNQHGSRPRNAPLVAGFGNPFASGIPVLLVLDENGTVLNTDPAERLRDFDHAHPERVLAYLKKWAE